jgi:WD40 repeat protein
MLIRQGQNWQQGQHDPVETYLELRPALGEDSEAVLDLIYHERVLRAQRGEVPRLEEYLERFPHLAAQLQVQFEVDQAIEAESTWESQLKRDRAADESAGPAHAATVAASPSGYEILEELGRGGMGIAYRAWQIGLKRQVTLKVIQSGDLANSEQRSRFRREAEAIGRLQHPHIVQVFEVGEHAGRPYLVLEYVSGGSLAQRLDGTPRPAREAAALVETLARAVDYAHRRGVIHRDLKPSNVLLALRGGECDLEQPKRSWNAPTGSRPPLCECTPKIADFGLAKILAQGQASQTQSGDILGTPSYMAPEQVGSSFQSTGTGGPSHAGPAADIYSLGATLYELLTGRPPFKAETPLLTLHHVVSQEPVPPSRLRPGLPRDLETICLKCLNKEPSRRYAGAGDLADDLHRFLGGAPIQARRARAAERAWRWCRRNPPLALACALAGIALAAAVTLAIGFGVAQRSHALTLERALTEARSQRRRATELAAGATFDRGIALCEQGERDRGLLMLAEGLRLLGEPGADLPPSPLGQTIRATIADWLGRSQMLVEFLDHEKALRASVLSPDGRLAATASDDGTARVWSTADGHLVATVPQKAPVQHLQFVKDGNTLLTIAGDTAVLWDARTGGELRSFTHTSPVQTADVDPGGRRVVLGGSDGIARIVELASGRTIGAALHHQGLILQARFLPPDGQTVLTASDDLTARLWRTESGQPQGAVINLTERPLCAAAAPAGRFVLIGCRDGTARLWDSGSGHAVGPPLRHGTAQVTAAVFRADGRMLVTGSRDPHIRVWNVGDRGIDGEPRLLRHQAPITSLALADDGRTLVAGCLSGQAFVWDMASRTSRHVLPSLGEVYRVAISRDGRTVVTSGQETAARLWRLPPDPSPGIKVPEKDIVYTMALSADRTMLVTAGDEGIARLWDTETGREIGKLAHGTAIRGVAFLPDGRSLVTVGDGPMAIIWELSSGKPRRQFVHAGRLWSVAVSPDGRLLLTGARDGVLALWEIETGRKRSEMVLHTGPAQAVSFSPDGRSFASASADQTAVVGRIDPLEPTAPRLRHHAQVWVAAFHPNGRVLLTGGDDKTIHLWEVATGQPLGPSLDHASRLRTAAFAPDGIHVLIGSDAGTSRFWHLESGKPSGVPLDADGFILAARFDPTTGEAITASEGVTLLRRSLPRPLRGDADTIAVHIQAITGLRLQSGGGSQVLDVAAWRHAAAKSRPPAN